MEVSKKYSDAMAEVLYYLEGIHKQDVEKIPSKMLEFFKQNATKDYKCEFDNTKPLKDLNLQKETKGLISMLCLKYWCETEEQKKEFTNILNENEKKYQQELSEKYSLDNIFKNEKKDAPKAEMEILTCEEKKWYVKLLDNIKAFLSKFKNNNKNT